MLYALLYSILFLEVLWSFLLSNLGCFSFLLLGCWIPNFIRCSHDIPMIYSIDFACFFMSLQDFYTVLARVLNDCVSFLLGSYEVFTGLFKVLACFCKVYLHCPKSKPKHDITR